MASGGGGGSGGSGGGGAGPSGAEPSNWLSEWRERTPLLTRCALFVVLPVSALSLLLGGAALTGNVPLLTVRGLQLWRPFTALLDLGPFFTLLFVVLMLATQAPAQEIRAGSLAFAAHALSTGLLVNVLYAALGALLALAGAAAPPGSALGALQLFGLVPSMGLWPVFLAATTVGALADPQGSSSFLCFTLPNRVFPWFLAAVFSLASFFPLLDLFIAVAVGHLQSGGRLDFLKPSARAIAAAETGAGWAVRLGLTARQGYVYHRDTVLPVGARALDREAAEVRAAAAAAARGAGAGAL